MGQERIKRAAAKIKAENPLFAGDLGFKHYTLQELPENVLDKMEEFSPENIIFANGMLDVFGRETVLATWKAAAGGCLLQIAGNDFLVSCYIFALHTA